MKKLQTILAAILCAAMVIASVPVALADAPQLVVSSASCDPGETGVIITVAIVNNPGFFAMQLERVFAPELVYKSSTTRSDLKKTGKVTQPNILLESQVVNEETEEDEDFTENGTILTLKFDVPETLDPGDYTITFNVLSANNYAREMLTDVITVVPGYIHVNNNGSLEVGNYKGDRAEADWTYPTQAGKVFAGWYTDSTYSTVYTETTGIAFPRFVDEKVAMVQAQKLVTEDASKATIRFISTLDTTEYDSAGFKITVGSKTATAEITKLYRTITAGGVSLTPSRVSGSSESQYITLFKLSNIPSSRFSDEITTVAFWKTKDGTVVTSNRPSVLTVDDFKDNYINAIAWDI